MKIIADNKVPFLKGVFDSYAEIEYLSPEEITNEKVKDADALIIRTRTKCGAKLLEGSRVKFIATATIGHDHIDSAYCAMNGIEWINAPGCNSSSVQQYVLAALLSLSAEKGFKLSGLTIGIIGAGNVGSKVEKGARLLGMNVMLNDPPRQRAEGPGKFVPVEEILEKADIVSFHVPLNKGGEDKTFHYADEAFFGSLKKRVIFINTSRGEVADTLALKKAIAEGKVCYAVIDVWENEPLIDAGLLNMTDIATPHIAGYSADGKANGTSVCVNAVSSYFNLALPSGWYPPAVPPPVNCSELEIDSGNLTGEQVFCKSIQHTYNIYKDDAELRSNPKDFEKLRDNYPVRREFNAYTISIGSAQGDIEKKLAELGFKIKI